MADKKFSDTPIDSTQIDDATDIQFGASNQVNSTAVDATVRLSEMQKVGHQDREITLGLNSEHTESAIDKSWAGPSVWPQRVSKSTVDLTGLSTSDVATLHESVIELTETAGLNGTNVGWNFRMKPAAGSPVPQSFNGWSMMKLGFEPTEYSTEYLNIAHGLEVNLRYDNPVVAGEPTAVTGIKVNVGGTQTRGMNSLFAIDIGVDTTGADYPAGTRAINFTGTTTVLANHVQGKIGWGSGASEVMLAAHGGSDANTSSTLMLDGTDTWHTTNAGPTNPLLPINLPANATAQAATWLKLFDSSGNIFWLPAWTG